MGRRRTGYIWKNVHGRKVKRDDPRPGSFFLTYTVSKNKRVNVCLETGKLEEAKARAEKIVTPIAEEANAAAWVRSQRRFLEEVESELSESDRPRVPVGELWPMFVRHPFRPRWKPNTLENNAGVVGDFVVWLTKERGIKTLFRVKPKVAQEYADHLKARGFSPRRHNDWINLVSTVVKTVGEEAGIVGDPFKDVRRYPSDVVRRYKQEHGRKVRALTPDEVKSLISCAPFGESQALFMLAAETGMRVGDLCTLRIREVDLGGNVLRRVPEKTRTTTGVVAMPPLTSRCAEMLRYFCLTKTGKDAIDPNSFEYVLPGFAEMYLGSKNSVWVYAKAIFEEAIERKNEAGVAMFHSFRHSYETLMRRAAVPQYLIDVALGHKTPGMGSVYAHLEAQDMQQLVPPLEAAYGTGR